MKNLLTLVVLLGVLACQSTESPRASEQPFKVEEIASFMEPWAMVFLPDGKILVTEKRGKLLVVTQEGMVSRAVEDVPDVAYRGQGGLGDVILHPDYQNNQLIYLSYAESGENNTRGAAVARGKLEFDDNDRGHLNEVEVIWRQDPKVTDDGHYGHRLAFDAQGYLFISSGERQKFDPSQDMSGNLGKIVRLNDDGSVPEDNPFFSQGGVTAEIWSSGHRNPLGLAFDNKGQLWNTEMGPLHGDELNRVLPGKNYGYPIVSDGDHYNGDEIPDHHTRPEFEAPAISWDPTIAPAEVIFYTGELFPEWQNSFLIAGLRPRAIIRVGQDGESVSELERFDMGKRIRELEQGPDGALWVLEDRDGGRLLRLTPSAAKPE